MLTRVVSFQGIADARRPAALETVTYVLAPRCHLCPGTAPPVSWGSRRRERKGKEEVRESIRSRSDGAVEVLVMGEKRKRVTARRGLPKAGSLVERKALFGAEEHQ